MADGRLIRTSRAANGPGYETRDANISGLVKFALSLAIILVVVSFGMKWPFDYFARTQTLGAAARRLESSARFRQCRDCRWRRRQKSMITGNRSRTF